MLVKQTRDDFLQRTGSGGKSIPKGKNLPESVNNIVWVRQLEARVEETMKTAEALLGDLPGFKSFRKDAAELLEELSTWRQETFDEWSRDVQGLMEDQNNAIW